MALNAHDSVRQADVGEILSALARHEGSASHSYPIMKLSAGAAVASGVARPNRANHRLKSHAGQWRPLRK